MDENGDELAASVYRNYSFIKSTKRRSSSSVAIDCSELLGEGGFGRVHLGFDEELQRQVAIKVPTPERFQNPGRRGALPRRGSHRRDTRSSQHRPCLRRGPHRAMARSTSSPSSSKAPRSTTGSRSDRLPTKRLRLVATIARALDHAHRKRLIHRDVKPANILIERESGTPYLADFGLAISEEDYLKENKVAGTPAYMSPEQVRGEGHRLDGRSDIFSLGVVFYELLTGKRPFRGSTTYELLHQVISVDPPCSARPGRFRASRAGTHLPQGLVQASVGPICDCNGTGGRSGCTGSMVPNKITSRSPSFPGGCGRSGLMMPTSSWTCCRALEAGMVCLRASDFGRHGSKRPIPTRPSMWASSTDRRAAVSRRW